ncbi:MAG TPA: hypothetical protein VN802_13760 [Stellaceae bacterium]|nr:hypothetical protein [Stellaceae bacterium]
MAVRTVGGKQQHEGWLVVRMAPWNVIGVYDDLAQARSITAASGPDYVVKWGSIPAGAAQQA